MKKINTRTIAVTGMLTAVSVVLMYLEFSIPFVPYFLKFDFSDLPALIGSFAFGPIPGIVICILKNLLHIFVSGSNGVGELSNLILSSAFVLPAGMIYRHHKSRKTAVIGSLSGSVLSAVVSIFSNYYVIYPIYYRLYMPKEQVLNAYRMVIPSIRNLWQALFLINLPFTLCKGVIISLICLWIYKPISPLLKGKQVR